MLFKLVYGNHWNFSLQIGDSFRYLKIALENIRYRADIERDICPGYINIVQKCFTDEFKQTTLEEVAKETQFSLITSKFLTKHQSKILYRLSLKGYNVVNSHNLTAPFHHDNLIARAKTCLNLKQFDTCPYPSNSHFFITLLIRPI